MCFFHFYFFYPKHIKLKALFSNFSVEVNESNFLAVNGMALAQTLNYASPKVFSYDPNISLHMISLRKTITVLSRYGLKTTVILSNLCKNK